MTHRFTLLLLILIPFFSNGQELGANAAVDSIKVWLAPGTYTAKIMTGNTGGERVEELSSRMMASIQSNQEWYLEFAKTIPEGGKMPYHENLGLTREEYDELSDIYENIQPASSGEEDFKITEKRKMIEFEAEGQLMGLNMLFYDVKRNAFFLDAGGGRFSPPLTFSETVNVQTKKDGPYSEWHGFEWKFEQGVPTNQEVEQLTNLDGVNLSQYIVTVGRTVNNEILLNLKITVIQNGEALAKNELPVLFK